MISSSAMRMACASGVPSRTSRTMVSRASALATSPYCVAAHAVGHQPQPEFAVAVIGIFVQLAPQAHMGQVSEFDHESIMPVMWGSQDG